MGLSRSEADRFISRLPSLGPDVREVLLPGTQHGSEVADTASGIDDSIQLFHVVVEFLPENPDQFHLEDREDLAHMVDRSSSVEDCYDQFSHLPDRLAP